MIFRKSVLLVLFILLTILAACGQSPAVQEIHGIHDPIDVEDGQVLVTKAEIRNNLQNFYLMLYPADSQVFFEVILKINGISGDPIEVQSWGEENLKLIDKDKEFDPIHSRRIIDQEIVDYNAPDNINFVYAYYFEIPHNTDYSAYVLYLPENKYIPLESILITPQPSPQYPKSELFTVVGGGSDNIASAYYTTVGGGQSNLAAAAHATIGGGLKNIIEGYFSTIGGGYANTVSGRDSVIGGGSRNSVEGDRCTIGGGIQNTAIGSDGTIPGGAYNVVADNYATVGGGTHNLSSGYASTISGGAGNSVSGDQASVGGGLNNQAVGRYSVAGGGYGNTARGAFSTVPGGVENTAAGDYSVAAGYQAEIHSDHPGVFLFADSNEFPFTSQAADEFAVRATGGVRFVSDIGPEGNPQVGVFLQPGSGSWSTLSDRSKKTDILPINPDEILKKLSQIEITSWRYRGQDSSVRHIGPMAGDMYQIFGFGENEQTISTVDADGISLAALQGLYQIMMEQEDTIEKMEDEISSLENTLFLTWVALSISLLSMVFAGYVLLRVVKQLPVQE